MPVARPGKVICLGLNYLEHVKEGGQRDNIPKFPTIFMRGQTSLVPHGQPIVRPQVTETLDYEAEMILVVGKRAKHLTAANALSCVAGYSCGNEGSVREFQRKTTQWDMGKNFDHTGGFGPWMVTADELPPGGKGLKIETRLNGKVMQSDNTDNMMFPVIEMLVYVTQGMTLEPGDIIFTGTPSGVGFARTPPVWMKNGDVCEIEIRASACCAIRSPTKKQPEVSMAVNVVCICGSLRKGSYNRMVMNALPGLAPADMKLTESPPFAEFPLYNVDVQEANGMPPAVQKLADAIRAADGVMFNSPEYNFSIPGGLKNAIDWVSRVKNQPFAGKPVAIQSAANGPLGGGRMQYDLRRVDDVSRCRHAEQAGDLHRQCLDADRRQDRPDHRSADGRVSSASSSPRSPNSSSSVKR